MKEILITLKTLPVSVNATYRRSRNSFYKSEEANLTQKAIQWEAKSQYRGKPLSEEIKVSIVFYWPDKRRHDIDNGLKGLLDALTGILWDDDSQIQEMRVRKYVDKANPRVELMIEL